MSLCIWVSPKTLFIAGESEKGFPLIVWGDYGSFSCPKWMGGCASVVLMTNVTRGAEQN